MCAFIVCVCVCVHVSVSILVLQLRPLLIILALNSHYQLISGCIFCVRLCCCSVYLFCFVLSFVFCAEWVLADIILTYMF